VAQHFPGSRSTLPSTAVPRPGRVREHRLTISRFQAPEYLFARDAGYAQSGRREGSRDNLSSNLYTRISGAGYHARTSAITFHRCITTIIAVISAPGMSEGARKSGGSMRSVLDRSFQYTPSTETDLRKTFARVRKRLREEQKARVLADAEVKVKVSP